MSKSITPKSRALGDAGFDLVEAATAISECVARLDEIDREKLGSSDYCAYRESEIASLYDRQDMLVQAISFTRCKTLTDAAIQLAILGQMNEALCASDVPDGEREEMLRKSRRLHFAVHELLTSEGATVPDAFRRNYLGENLNPWIDRNEAVAIVRQCDTEEAQDKTKQVAA